MSAQVDVCETCNGRGEIGGWVGQTAETASWDSMPCPDCDRQEAQAWQNIETAEVEFLNNLADKGGLADPVPGMLRHCARLLGGGQKAAWIVANGQSDRWRFWGDSGPEWTPDRDKALQFARRDDAEAFARDDEDAWLIQPIATARRASALAAVGESL